MDFKAIEQLLDLPRVRVSQIKKTNDKIYLWLYIPEGQHICPVCGQYHSHVEPADELLVRDLSILGKETYLYISRGYIHCSCSYEGFEQLEFVNTLQPVTNRFAFFSLFYYNSQSMYMPSLPEYDHFTGKNHKRVTSGPNYQNVA